jgi:hypothetical protein
MLTLVHGVLPHPLCCPDYILNYRILLLHCSVCVSCTLNGFYQSSSSSPHPHRNLDVAAVRGEQVAATFLRITASHAYPPSPKRLT